MDTDQGRVHLCKGNHINPPPHNIPPRGGPLANFFPKPGHKFSHRGEHLENFGLPGRMDTDQGQDHLCRGNHNNPSPHDIPPLGGPLAKTILIPGHEFSQSRKPLKNILVAGLDGHQSGSGAPAQRQPITTRYPPQGGTPSKTFLRPGHKFFHKGEPLERFWLYV